jgi:hypothetical protein
MINTQTTPITQNNMYNVIDACGRNTDFYVIASNIKEACSEVKRIAKEQKKNLGMYYKVKRCYNGGVRG